MATTTVTGRFFFALGAYITASIFSSNDEYITSDSVHTKSITETSSSATSTTSPTASVRGTKQQQTQQTQHYTTDAIADMITDLPGLSYDPGFNQFSGYLDASPTRHIFYWYVESQSNPTTDPVVLWTNGGPGCSGLLGFGTEHGPFHIDGTGNITSNGYSWNRIANMLYVEQPAGVGYSFYDTEGDATTGDAQAASDNYQLILSFLKRFPERKPNPFYIASESYGGHYMPQLAMEILRRDFFHDSINFRGMMVGNPYVDPYTNTITQIRAFYNHGLIAKPLFDKWTFQCENPDTYYKKDCLQIEEDMFEEFGSGINPYALDYPVCYEEVFLNNEKYEFQLHTEGMSSSSSSTSTSNTEATLIASASRHGRDSRFVGRFGLERRIRQRRLSRKHHHHHDKNNEGLYYYDDDDYSAVSVDDDVSLDDDEVLDDIDDRYGSLDGEKLVETPRTFSSEVDAFIKRNKDNILTPSFLPDQDKGYKPCSQVHLERYLNRHDVREALHVREEGGYLWTTCSKDLKYSDIDFDNSVIDEYKELIKMAIARRPNGNWINDLNMLIFSGDDDAIASTAGTQDWIWDLGLPPKSHDEWMAWKVNNQTAGFVVHFQLPGHSASTFVFATIHGAGHEVPAYRPYEALELFARYLDRTL